MFSSCHNEISQKEFPYNEITISELRKGYSNGEFTVYDVISAYIEMYCSIEYFIKLVPLPCPLNSFIKLICLLINHF